MNDGGPALAVAPPPSARKRSARKRSPSTSAGLRLTKVGFWSLLLGIVLLLAATNTGNNGLYLVLATMGGVLVASQPLAAGNVRRLRVALSAPDEIFAHQPTRLGLAVTNTSRWLPCFLLVTGLAPGSGSRRPAAPALIGHLAASGRRRADLELIAHRRGRWRPLGVTVSSLFPFGFFHKVRRYPVALEMIVYPEVFAPPAGQPLVAGRTGDDPARNRGWGHDLHSLRRFRDGDDPRAIHWKQTARTGTMIVKERALEESRRLSIVFDNAAGDLDVPNKRERFERLVSEAATAALDVLTRGFEVELITRSGTVPFASGWRQRRRLLETLALIDSVPSRPGAPPLDPSSPKGYHLRLAMERDVGGAEPRSAPP